MLLSGFVIIDKKMTQNTYNNTHILQENKNTKGMKRDGKQIREIQFGGRLSFDCVTISIEQEKYQK